MGWLKMYQKYGMLLRMQQYQKVSLYNWRSMESGYLALQVKRLLFDVALAWPTAKISLTSL